MENWTWVTGLASKTRARMGLLDFSGDFVGIRIGVGPQAPVHRSCNHHHRPEALLGRHDDRPLPSMAITAYWFCADFPSEATFM